MTTITLLVSIGFSHFFLCKATSHNRESLGINDLTNEVIPNDTVDCTFQYNDIPYIPANYFLNLPQITKLNMNWNDIAGIADHAFSNIPSLVELKLKRNPFERITRWMFSGLIHLEVLFIPNHKIQTIEAHSFADLIALRNLNLRAGDLISMPASVFNPSAHPNYIS